MNTTAVIPAEALLEAYSYTGYIKLIEDELAQGRTTGPNQSPELVDYARLNFQRMRRLSKTTVLLEEVRQALDRLAKPQLWVVLSEGWCGDAAQIVPVMAKFAEYSSKVGMKILLRDENPDIMDRYLTRGGRSIPKLIALEPESLRELGSWGPRPTEAQRMVETFKTDPQGRSKEEFITAVHHWYAQDKTLSTQRELLESLQQWDQA